MSFFKRLFAKVAPNVDLSQIDEKAESDFNEAFATLVNEQVSAVSTAFEDRIKALEQKETPNTEGFATTEAVTALENKLATANEALNKANSSIEALTTKANDLAETLANKAAEAPKGKENTTIAIPNKAENTGYKGGFV